MKKIIFLSLLSLLLVGCNKENSNAVEVQFNDYGAFLGRIDNDVTDFNKYTYISCEFDEFGDSNINRLTQKGIKFFAYLNVGSLENYRDYYEDFESYTFLDYENWPDEKWIDITHTDWQEYVVNTLAKGFKNRNAFGVYLDNADVYSVAFETGRNKETFGIALTNIIKGISNLGLKVMINGGSEFIDDMLEQENDVIDSIWAYHQEEVFSLIKDYDNNIFGTQYTEDREYYQEIATKMKEKGKEVFFLEYTVNNSLIKDIRTYCFQNSYHYYISSSIELN